MSQVPEKSKREIGLFNVRTAALQVAISFHPSLTPVALARDSINSA